MFNLRKFLENNVITDLISPNTRADQERRLREGKSARYIKGEPARTPRPNVKQPARLPQAQNQSNPSPATTRRINQLQDEASRQTGFGSFLRDMVDANTSRDRLNRLQAGNQEVANYQPGADTAMTDARRDYMKQLSQAANQLPKGDPRRDIYAAEILAQGSSNTSDIRRNLNLQGDPSLGAQFLGGFIENQPLGLPFEAARFAGFDVQNPYKGVENTKLRATGGNPLQTLARGAGGLAADAPLFFVGGASNLPTFFNRTIGGRSIGSLLPGAVVGGKHGTFEAADQAEAAEAAGKSFLESRLTGGASGAFTAATSAFGTSRLLKSPTTGTSLTTNLVNKMAGEGLEEGIQQFGSNVAERTYNPDKNLFEDVASSSAYGGILAAPFGLADIGRSPEAQQTVQTARKDPSVVNGQVLGFEEKLRELIQRKKDALDRGSSKRVLQLIDESIADTRGQLRIAKNAQRIQSPTGNTIGGINATAYEQAKQAGRVFEGVDGKERFEIDDSGADVNIEALQPSSLENLEYRLGMARLMKQNGVQNPEIDKAIEQLPQRIQAVKATGGGKKKALKMSDVLKHDAMYEQYPELKDVKVKILNNRGFETRAVYNPSTNTIELNKKRLDTTNPDRIKADVLHEIQHAIQGIEGFAPGSYDKNMDNYNRSAGEAEARAVANRMNMSDGERYVPDAAKAGDYTGVHEAPTNDGYSSPGHDLTEMYGDDIYSEQAWHYYGHGGDSVSLDKQSAEIIKSLRGNPDKEITVYRSVPKGVSSDINPGDWVTINKNYAEQHGRRFDDGMDIIEKTVKASEIFTDGNSIHEFGYDPGTGIRSTFYDSLDVPKEDLIIRDGSGKAMSIDPDQTIKDMRQGKINPETGKRFQEVADQSQLSQAQEASPGADTRTRATRTGVDASRAEALRDGEIQPNITPVRAESLERLDLTPEAQRVAQAAKKNQLPDYKNVRAVRDLYSSSDNSLPPDIVAAQANKTYPIKRKVGFLDYLRTPDRVLKKIGLEQEAKEIRQAHQNYVRELPQQLDKINGWWKQVNKSQQSSESIFRWLDGEKDMQLDKTEAKVANEIKEYLDNWADRLALPKDRRVSNYITHIFEDSLIEKEFDPEIQKLIRDKVPGSVYDPFTEQRLGGKGYKRDVFLALDAYAKRGVRKANMDAALFNLRKEAENLDDSAWDYVKQFGDRVNMRPTKVDTLIDNGFKQVFGYKFGSRPTNKITQKIRNATYRATLGLNIGSAIRNLTQGVNTFGELGTKWTGIGYTKATQDLFNSNSELEEVGVLSDSFIEDRHTSALKSKAQKLDKGLWFFFDTAEKINRGAAYYGAKQRALSRGASIEQAIAEGIEMARKTQFTFGAVDNPALLNSDISKFILQFQSFNVKQAEFVIEAAQNKEFAKLARMAGASWVILATVGNALGYEPEDFIPFSDVLTGESRIGQTPFIEATKTTAKLLSGGGEDDYGNPVSRGDRAKELVGDVATATVPGYVQANKTYGGLKDVSRGYSTSRGGGFRYPVDQTAGNYIRGALLGRYSFDEAREYFDNGRAPFGEKKTEELINTPNGARQELYDFYRTKSELESDAGEQGKTPSQTRGELAERVGGEYDDYISAFGLDETKRDPDTIAKMAIKGTGYDGLPDNILDQYLKENNLERSDIEYAVDAEKGTDDKLSIFSQQEFKDRKSMLNYLAEGRTKSIDGNYRANEKLLRTLYDNGVIDNNELYGLLNIVDGKYQKSSSGGSSSSSGGSRSSGGGSSRGKFDYDLFSGNFGVDPLATTGSLRSLIEQIG